ncbi:hypothetical protein D3C77_396080 [compost metagenome]
MLSSARLRDHLVFAHALCEQSLTDRVVDFVRPGMVQVLTLQINFSSAQLFCQTVGIIERSFSSGILLQQIADLLYKLRVVFIFTIRLLQLDERIH